MLKRSEPIKRSALKRSDSPIKRSMIARRPVKDKAAADLFQEQVMTRAAGRCEIGPLYLTAAMTWPDPEERAIILKAGRRCRGYAQHGHHVVGRGMGGHSAHDPADGLATCWRCHQFAHDHPAIAEAVGAIRRRT